MKAELTRTLREKWSGRGACVVLLWWRQIGIVLVQLEIHERCLRVWWLREVKRFPGAARRLILCCFGDSQWWVNDGSTDQGWCARGCRREPGLRVASMLFVRPIEGGCDCDSECCWVGSGRLWFEILVGEQLRFEDGASKSLSIASLRVYSVLQCWWLSRKNLYR